MSYSPKGECCCTWGAAVGRRWGVKSDEWPEFGCYRCPVHQAGLGEQPDELCKRHRREVADHATGIRTMVARIERLNDEGQMI